ncbi:4-alpha-glucanotransferase [Gilvimarinus sp. DA14]|uniref:4-alpha-glucanotransferase n=1 Tax=Gilvimarinus sp. DA14 TaxID=2956798 RepID=UPI0020B77952|nr:4-alpha-glucanotransferase [Gilvimarinus sp. DA14]UTF60667.1 4-alpha-glucanotransferase [Gilvimarinus sp. DA14]
MKPADIFNRRTAGCLLHPSSLPAAALNGCAVPCGNLGYHAKNFVRFLHDAGLSVWQMLPTGPTHDDRSPYQSWSAHAGNPEFICLQTLIDWGWINPAALQGVLKRPQPLSFTQLAELRVLACEAFYAHIATPEGGALGQDFKRFIAEQHHWLDDFSLFLALRNAHQGASWLDWEASVRLREPEALTRARKLYRRDIEQAHFEQFAFYSQWQALKQTALEQGVQLFGDIPIFVALDSADVWAHPEQFKLDSAGKPLSVAGVPPDYFSATGQHWGNPHYNWAVMQADNFSWWRERIAGQLAQFDLIRIDHFRGLEAYWEIPADAQDARGGKWVEAPGQELLASLFEHFHSLPIVAENLGLITDKVEALRKQFALPGMLVLQFGFDGNAENINAPHHFEPVNIVYTGTHDNDTTAGWLASLSTGQRLALGDYLGAEEVSSWGLIKTALASVARMAIIPLQDFLQLDNSARMNTPGTTDNNWHWRFDWSELPENLAVRIHHEVSIYDRLGRDLPFAQANTPED